MPAAKAVGIDLGTTNSCVAVFENREVTIITNDNSKRTTPSIVGFLDGLKPVGQYAKEKMYKFPADVIFCIKRLIGRKFDDPKVQKVIEDVPFKIVADKNGNAAVQVKFRDDTTVFTPEQIAALILSDLKRTANRYLPYEVKDAVITIPAYFNDAQRQATIDAARITGINVLRLINEPTAAALAYAYKEKWKNGKILVYDLGGGTLDVSLIDVTDGKCEVRAVSGNDHLGGEDFDNILVKYCVEEFELKHHQNISNDARAISLLKAACEDAKIDLSDKNFAIVEIEDLYGDIDFECKIRRSKFIELCKELVEKTLQPVQKVLEDAGITKADINNVVLVGGSTRIPYIQETLTQFFDGKKLSFDINPDEAVANGAAILAAHLSKTFDTSIQNIRLLDVIPRSLGTDLYLSQRDKKGYFNMVARRNSTFPFEFKSECTTLYKNQDVMDIAVYEGDDADLIKNKKLGDFTLMNIAPGKSGEVIIEITFKVDENAILTVTAVDKRSKSVQSIEIRPDKGRLTDAQILEMSKEIQLSFDEIVID